MAGNGSAADVMQPLATRADIDRLLRAFYERVFEDDLLGHVFVDVAGMDLDAHLPVLGDFWEKVLFNTGVYSGHMMDVHRRVNELETFTPAHFARWLAVWGGTVDAGSTARSPTRPRRTRRGSRTPCSAALLGGVRTYP